MKHRNSLLVALLLLCPVVQAQEKPIARIYYVPSGSMEPTLNISDRIWASPVPYEKADPKRGDIAIMQMTSTEVSPWDKSKGKGYNIDMLKRVVGVPGDRVEVVNRKLYVNGKIQQEPFVKWEDNIRYDMKVVGGQVYSREYDTEGTPGNWTCKGALIAETLQDAISRAKTGALPAKQYLVLGDNRSNSNDSHSYGLVKRAAFIAKVTLRIYPYPRTF